MLDPHRHSRWSEALRRHGLPASYVNRVVGEWADHEAELREENPSMDAERLETRMGTAEQLATFAAAEFRRRTFAGRHPVLTFVAGPVVVSVVMFAATLAAIACGYRLTDWATDWATDGKLTADDAVDLPPSKTEFEIVEACNVLVRFLPFGLSAGILAFAARRSGRRRWGYVACGIVAALAAVFVSRVTIATAVRPATWTMGFDLPVSLEQLIQALVPAAWAGRLLLRSTEPDSTPSVTA